MSGFEWARPGWAWTFLAPLVLWFLLRLRHRPPSVVTGAWRLWKEVARDAPQHAKALKRGTPPWVAFCIGALLAGALALTGPRTRQGEAPRCYTIVVDPTPSMDLVLDPEAGAASETRRQRALAQARAWIVDTATSTDLVQWVVAGSSGEAEPSSGVDPPVRALRSRPFAQEPDWRLYDRPGTLIVTDRIPGGLTQAGFVASGGRAVYGTVAVEGRDRVEWDASGGSLVPGGAPLQRIVIERGVPEVLSRMARVWATTHALEVLEGIGPEDFVTADGFEVLRLAWEPGAEDDVGYELRHEGWSARGTGHGLLARGDARAPGENWLVVEASGNARKMPVERSAAGKRVLVRGTPGRIQLGLSALEEPTGDPARFALSWGRLFDRHRMPTPGVVPLAEREDAGAAEFRTPAAAPRLARNPDEEPRLRAGEIDAWLAGLACVLALVAVSLRRS